MRRIFIFLLLVFFAASSLPLLSQTVQKDLQAQFVLKIISLDRNFDRYGDPIRIGVTSNAMFRAMNRFSKQVVKGKKFAPELMNTLDDISKYDAFYLDKNWDANHKAALEKAKEHKVLMFSYSYRAVERAEAGVAFRTVLGKPKIVVNLGVIKEEGSDFPSNFLTMTMVFGSI